MEARPFRTDPFPKTAPARVVPLVRSGTLLDDWSEQTFGTLKHELPRRRS